MNEPQLPRELEALSVINNKSDLVYALTFNPRTSKWTVLRLLRPHEAKPGTFHVEPFSAGSTPGMAVKDALTLLTVSRSDKSAGAY